VGQNPARSRRARPDGRAANGESHAGFGRRTDREKAGRADHASAGGRPTPSFTIVQTGNTVTLDASASPPCTKGGCDFSWRVYLVGGNRLGSTMGFGPVVTYTLPAAGVYQVVLTESEYCVPGGGASLRSCPGVAQQTVTVT
jgi:hypothetical protein